LTKYKLIKYFKGLRNHPYDTCWWKHSWVLYQKVKCRLCLWDWTKY